MVEFFINKLNIMVEISIAGKYDPKNKKSICVKIIAHKNYKIELLQYYNYSISDKYLIYEDFLEIKGVDDGVFAALSDKITVHNYFQNKAKNFALDYINPV